MKTAYTTKRHVRDALIGAGAMLLYKGRARADAGEGGDIFVLDVESADGDVLADGKYSGDIVFASAPRMMRFGD